MRFVRQYHSAIIAALIRNQLRVWASSAAPMPYEIPATSTTYILNKFVANSKAAPAAKSRIFFLSPGLRSENTIAARTAALTKPVQEFAIENIPSSTKIKLVKILLPTFLLFVFGLVFSYVLVIPWTLDFLYSYGESIGAEAFLTVNDFITFVLQFVLGFGIAFQLPIIMYVLSLSGLTDSKFWQKNFRYAIIIITIFGAVITPDGSGITMWFVALPMIALYAFGIIAIRRNERKVVTAESS